MIVDAIPERAIRNPIPFRSKFLSAGWIPVSLSNLFPDLRHFKNFLSKVKYCKWKFGHYRTLSRGKSRVNLIQQLRKVFLLEFSKEYISSTHMWSTAQLNSSRDSIYNSIDGFLCRKAFHDNRWS